MNNNDLFYIGLKGVFCFKPPFPQLCEIVIPKVSSQLAIFVSNGATVFGTGSTPTMSTSIYKFTDSSITSGSVLNGNITYKAGAGNSTTAIFGGGSDNGKSTNLSYLYNYSSDTFTSGANLTYSFIAGGAASNSTTAIFGSGYTSQYILGGARLETTSTLGSFVVKPTLYLTENTCLYTYLTNTAVNSTSLTTESKGINAVGNSTVVIFGLGVTTNQNNQNANACIYTYSNASVSSSFILAIGNVEFYPTAAAGNTEKAIFVNNGQYSASSIIYNYSSGSINAAAALDQATLGISSGTGTSTVGIFGSGNVSNDSSFTSTLYQYEYSSGIFTASQNLTFSRESDSAACNSNIGVNT